MQLRSTMALGLSLLITGCAGCSTVKVLSDAFKDSDGDGWIDEANNVATVLTLESATFSAAGSYRIYVDEVRFPLDPTLATIDRLISATANTPIALNFAVTKRTYGRNIVVPVTKASMNYTASLRVLRQTVVGPWDDLGTTTVPFSSDDKAPIVVTLGGGALPTATLTFSSANTRFPDPNPSADGDSDGDGIRESEEFLLANGFGGIGDPRPGMIDAVLIVGHTEPSLALDPYTTEQLKSRFFQRNINLHIDSGTLNGAAGAGGLMRVSGSTVTPGTRISVSQLPAIRSANIPADRQRFTYFALLAAGVATGEFGRADMIPGRELVMRAVIAPLTPNAANYQAGVLMHEFGHLLGLCHPTLQTGTAPCAAIPSAERNPATTVMGTPAESPGIIGFPNAVVQALSRPLDYSPTQRTLLRLGAAFPPP